MAIRKTSKIQPKSKPRKAGSLPRDSKGRAYVPLDPRESKKGGFKGVKSPGKKPVPSVYEKRISGVMPKRAASPISKTGMKKPTTQVQKVARATVRKKDPYSKAAIGTGWNTPKRVTQAGKATMSAATKNARANITALEKKKGRKLTTKERTQTTRKSASRTVKRRNK